MLWSLKDHYKSFIIKHMTIPQQKIEYVVSKQCKDVSLFWFAPPFVIILNKSCKHRKCFIICTSVRNLVTNLNG